MPVHLNGFAKIFCGSTSFTSRALRVVLILFVTLCYVMLYVGLHERYLPDNSDDSWTTSYAYNYFKHGRSDDVVFGSLGGGLSLFGYTYAFAQKVFLNAFGWTRSNALMLSTFFLLWSLPIWWGILRYFGLTQASSLCLCVTLPLWEPHFRAANTARPDSLCFTLSSLALLLALKNRFILAGAAAGAALEVHQMGVLAILYVSIRATSQLVRIWRQADTARFRTVSLLCLRLGLGLGLGLGYYFYLHFDALQLGTRVVKARATWGGHYFFDYFFITKSYRHLPELGLILLGLFLFVKTQRKKPSVELLAYAGAAMLLGFLMPRANFFYTVYFYIWCVAFWGVILNERAKTHWLLVVCLSLMLPQYSYIYFRTKEFSTYSYISAIKEYVKPQGLPIVGTPLDWFAFMDHEFYAYPCAKLLEDKRSFLYVQRNDARTAYFGDTNDPYLKSLNELALVTKENTFFFYRWFFVLYRIDPKP